MTPIVVAAAAVPRLLLGGREHDGGGERGGLAHRGGRVIQEGRDAVTHEREQLGARAWLG